MKLKVIINITIILLLFNCTKEAKSETETSSLPPSVAPKKLKTKDSYDAYAKAEKTISSRKELYDDKYYKTEIKEQLNLPKAGEHDDNEELQYFLKFLNDRANFSPYSNYIDSIRNRLLIAINDKNDLPVYQAEIIIKDKKYYTYADGEIIISEFSENDYKNPIQIQYLDYKTNLILINNKLQRQIIKLNLERKNLTKIPVDIVFLMDTTGSMQDEIDILKDTIYSIYMRIKKLPVENLTIRFGMVLYRDKGDEYLTKKFELTESIEDFQKFLFKVNASGGGDYPEDLYSGLKETVNMLNWGKNSLKLVFLITDAPDHMDSIKNFFSLIQDAISKNIKIFSIGASGLNIVGEIQLRILSQQTKGKFIFLTYGEKGESEGTGSEEDPGKVSHHTGANYQSRNLDDIVVDNVKNEIYHQMSKDFLANFHEKYDFRTESDKIQRRVDNAIKQLKKQLSIENKITSSNTVLILEPDYQDPSLRDLSIHIASISENLIKEEKMLKIVDRSKLSNIIEELKLKLSGFSSTSAENIKEITEADTILTGKLYYIGNSTVFHLRLLDASTSEVLAASMVRM